MKSHRFIDNQLYLTIQYMANECKAKESNGFRFLFVLFVAGHHVA